MILKKMTNSINLCRAIEHFQINLEHNTEVKIQLDCEF